MLNRNQSVGLFSDRNLLVASRWFEGPSSSPLITAGTTVGMLVNIPSEIVNSKTSIPSVTKLSGSYKSNYNEYEDMSHVVVSVAPDPDISNTTNSNENQTNQNSSDSNSSCNLPLLVQFNIDGHPLHFSSEAQIAINDIACLNAPLYPTISIISEGTKVWCRLCEADIVYRMRSAIGAPPEARVYSLDGSLLIGDN